MKVKLHVNWKKVIVFLLISAGLIFLTHSLLMSIGIVLLLFVVDALLANYEYRKQTKAFLTTCVVTKNSARRISITSNLQWSN